MIYLNRLVRLVVLISALLLLAGAAIAESDDELRQKTFYRVWELVNERFYDPNFNGVDWAAVKVTYEKKLLHIKDDYEYYRLLNEMLGELRCSHFQVIPPFIYMDEAEGNTIDSDIGITVRIVEDKPTITQVEPDSSAAKAGIKPGFILTHLDGLDVSKIWEQIQSLKEPVHTQKAKLAYAFQSRFTGKEGTEIELQYLDEKDESHKVTLKRAKSTGQEISMGELPKSIARVESKLIDDDIGYICFNVFVQQTKDAVREAVKSFHNASGIIIDLRGNSGGVGAMSMPIASLFHSQMSSLGTMKLRQGEIRYPVFASADPFKGVLIILTDETSASTSEILAGGMQASGRAIIVGGNTMGAALPSVTERLPTGARLQYAIADFKTPKGIMIEGRGIAPDVVVEIKRQDLLAGRDPVLEKAITLVKEKKADAAAPQKTNNNS